MEAIKQISNSDNSTQGERCDEDLTDELFVSVALIVKPYEERRVNMVRRAQFKGSSSARRSTSKKRNSCNCFNCGSLDHFSTVCKKKKKAKILENYKVLYKKLVSCRKKTSLCLRPSLQNKRILKNG